MKTQLLLTLALSASLVGCSGGGMASSTAAPANISTPQSAGGPVQSLGITFTGSSTLSRSLAVQSVAGTPVTVRFNGATIASGTLDGSGHAMLTLSPSVPPGATVSVAAGTTTVTIVLSSVSATTAAAININPDGTLSVTAVANPSGFVTPGDNDVETETEDKDGHILIVNNQTAVALPTTLPFTFSGTCTSITLTPKATAVAAIRFEEKSNDSDAGNRFEFRGAFTGPLVFPVVAASARAEVRVFDAQGNQLVELRVPIASFTGACTTPSPAPSATASIAASPRPAPSATASQTPEPRESEHPTPQPSPSPSPR